MLLIGSASATGPTKQSDQYGNGHKVDNPDGSALVFTLSCGFSDSRGFRFSPPLNWPTSPRFSPALARPPLKTYSFFPGGGRAALPHPP